MPSNKKERPIFLTDIGRNNTTRVRRLPYGEPGNVDEDGWVTQMDGTRTRPMVGIGIAPQTKSSIIGRGKMRSANEPSKSSGIPGIYIATRENLHKDLEHGKPLPEDPDPNALLFYEAQGATILESTTYFPQSRQTVTTRSQTQDEIEAERRRKMYDL